MATRDCGDKIDGRHISIIAPSEHHIDYMNRKGWYSVIMQEGPFHRCSGELCFLLLR